jgi:uncharacterized protein YndB with AHSA1/START domain
MKEIPTNPEQVVVYGDFHGFEPEELFTYWIEPERVTQWWPKVVEIDARPGGNYKFSWPDQGWHLQGSYAVVDPGKHLRFSWTWNPESGFDPLWVDIYFMPIEGGTRAAIFQGPYSLTDADQEARQGNIEGWIHFGSRLAGLRAGEPE